MNKFLIASVLSLCGLILSATHLNAGGGRVGSAGDWRRIMIDQSQREAANWVNTAALNQDYFNRDTTLPSGSIVLKFVRYPNALKMLATDIIASEHIFLDESVVSELPYTTCAWTNDPTAESLNDIVFTLSLCEEGLKNGGTGFANRLAIHESVHHLLQDKTLRKNIGAVFSGTPAQQTQQEEHLCDEIALAIHRVFDAVVFSGKPHWIDIQSPYFEQPDRTTKALDARGFHATVWTGATGNSRTKDRLIVWGGCQEGDRTIYACGDENYFNDGAMYNPADDTWTLLSPTQAPSARAEPASVWTGDQSVLKNRMIIWGGCTKGEGCETRLNDGGIYDPDSNSWDPIPATAQSPAARVHHSAVWTGSQFIVWGGHPDNGKGRMADLPLQTGGIYDPQNKNWTPTPIDSETPTPRGYHTALWTGATGNASSTDKMLIWGGCAQEIADDCPRSFADGAFFDPVTMKWSKLNATGPQPKARHNYSSFYIADQSRLYIFGGLDTDGNVIAEGMILDLKQMKWIPMPSMTEGRFKHKAVWAGDKMLVFGGKKFNLSTRTVELADSVIAFLPAAPGAVSPGRWITYHTDEMVPLKTCEHSAVWTGDAILVWGGQIFDRGFTNTGSKFFPGL